MTPSLFDKFPKNRPVLDERYQKIYRQEYTRSREGLSFINDLAQRAESWMHRIASGEKAGRVLEIGAKITVDSRSISFNSTKGVW